MMCEQSISKPKNAHVFLVIPILQNKTIIHGYFFYDLNFLPLARACGLGDRHRQQIQIHIKVRGDALDIIYFFEGVHQF
jgi:hypothetical protein